MIAGRRPRSLTLPVALQAGLPCATTGIFSFPLALSDFLFLSVSIASFFVKSVPLQWGPSLLSQAAARAFGLI